VRADDTIWSTEALLKLSDNPPMRPPGVQSVSELSGRWWVGHTRARFEKTFAWDMAGRGVGYFLPLIERVRFSGGRKRRVMLPLFTSYVFFCGGPDVRRAAMTTNRLARVIEVADQHRLLEELASVERALGAKADLALHPHAAVGRRCRIASGPLQGIEGVVVQQNGRARVVMNVSILGQGASVEVEAGLIESVN